MIKIAGIDSSLNSTGKCVMTLDDEYNIKEINLYGFHSTKKRCITGKNLDIYHVGTQYKKRPMPERQNIAYDFLEKYMEGVKYVAFEGYSYNSNKTNSSIVQLGEFCGGLKRIYYNMGMGIVIYAPKMVKRFATGDGEAGKVSMGQMFAKEFPDFYPTELTTLPQHESPHEDICDAFWMAETLRNQIMYEKKKDSLDEGTIAMLEYRSVPTGKKKTQSIVEMEMYRK